MILLDGRPITDYPLAVLHRDISYVPQENFLFSDTLEENIAFGLEDRIADNPAILDAVKQAAKDACIHDNIMGFPDEYKTMVGERGVTLSGGQKQRSSIARALLRILQSSYWMIRFLLSIPILRSRYLKPHGNQTGQDNHSDCP